MNKFDTGLLFLIVVGVVLIVIAFVVPMPLICVFMVSMGGGMLFGTGASNAYLDWSQRRNRRLGK